MSKRKTVEEFKNESYKVHGDKYNYDSVIYKNNNSKVKIICPVHGEFEQTPKLHLKGSNCPICSERKITLNECLNRFKKSHGDKYDYSQVSYEGANVKVKILCSEHGVFWQRPSSHWEGTGCQKCMSDSYRSTTKEFIEKAKLVHKDKYNYSKTEYKNTAMNKVIIICPEHGDFEQTCSDHLSGAGCPACAKSGFDPNKPAILYYLKITTDNNQVLYKIGITNRTVNERFSLNELSKIEIIKQEEFECGQNAKNKEAEILKKYKQYKYIGPNILESGNTELFTEDVLTMYKEV